MVRLMQFDMLTEIAFLRGFHRAPFCKPAGVICRGRQLWQLSGFRRAHWNVRNGARSGRYDLDAGLSANHPLPVLFQDTKRPGSLRAFV